MSRTVGASLIYLMIVTIAAVAVGSRRDEVRGLQNYRAVASLPKSHRLVEGDLAIPRDLPRRLREALPAKKDLAGKYLLHAVERNEPVRPSDLTDRPSLAASLGHVTVMFDIKETAVCSSLDAGDFVDLYTQKFGPKPDQEAQVIAVFPGTPSCRAALDVRSDEADVFLHSAAKLVIFHRGDRMKQHWSTPKIVDVKATRVGQWQLAIENVPPKTTLRIKAADGLQWTVGDKACTPDGLLEAGKELGVNGDYPVGSLLGKIGGSTAGSKEGTTFAIGRYCIVQNGESPAPLFVALNLSAAAPFTANGKIVLEISEAE